MSQTGILTESTGGGTEVLFLAGNSGGNVGPNNSGVISVVGAGGVTVAGNPGTSTLTVTVSGSGLTWNVIAGSSATMAVNNGYITTNSSTTSLTLPATSNVGDYITIIGNGTGQWTIVQGTGQQVRIGSAISTSGAGGSVSSFNSFNSIDLVCAVANTLWLADGAPQSAGLTVV